MLGRVVEIVSGQSLDEFFAQRIFDPLGMSDTGFSVSDADRPRMTALYAHDPATATAVPYPGVDVISAERPKLLAGGHGLASTAADYHRFSQMLLNGGELDGARLLSPKTIELMTVSHTGDLTPSPQGPAAGFGLGFRVITDLGQSQRPASVGSYSWGGIWGTSFWVDPKERLVGVMMIQRYPTTGVPIADVFQAMAYQAIVR